MFGQNFSSISSLIGTLEGAGGPQVEPPSSTTRTTFSRTNSNGVKSSTTTNTSVSRTTANDSVRRTTTSTTTSSTTNPVRTVQPTTTLSSKASSTSALSTFTPPLSRALDDEQSATKRRRIDGDGNKEQNDAKEASTAPAKRQLTREEKIAILKKRKIKEKMAAMQEEKANNGTNGASSSTQKSTAQAGASTTTKAPAKGSYAEVLARAKAMQETAAASQPTKIVHKHHKVEKEKTTWQKKMADKKNDRGNSAGNSETEKGVISRKLTSSSMTLNGKRPTTLAASRTKSAPSTSTLKKPETNQPMKRKREEEIPKIEWKGTARGAPSAPPSRGKSLAREREYRSPPRMQPRYRYADSEDDYDSESDMEANGLDILEEEELSRKRAIKEDEEAERLERELKAKKIAAKKKALAGGR